MARASFLLLAGCLLSAVAWVAVREYRQRQSAASHADVSPPSAATSTAADGSQPVRLSRQARENMGLVSKPLQTTEFWRSIDLPGVIVDRPGISDRGVVSPVSGVVTEIHAFPGDMVHPSAELFSIRLISESLHTAQMELFKATENIEIARQELARLSEAAQRGALPQSRIIEIENEIKRLNVAVRAYRQDLLTRGLPPDGIASAAKGEFVNEVVVSAPADRPTGVTDASDRSSAEGPGELPNLYEMQSLEVELGTQVESGQLLCRLADHRALFIEGRAFMDDMPLVQAAAENGWTVDLDFGAANDGRWPGAPKEPTIHHVANSIDPETRTFAFYLPLTNQSQPYTTAGGERRFLWRFRPGERVRLRVPVQHMEDVFVLPREAVVKEGPEAYVFRQNGDLFERRAVRVLYEDSRYVVLANDGSIRRGIYVAQNNAASLNRVLKAQGAGGAPAGVHVHADGTVHGAH